MLQVKLDYEKKKFQLDLDRQKIENDMLEVEVRQIHNILAAEILFIFNFEKAYLAHRKFTY